MRDFKKIVLGYYRRHGRNLPWRKTRDPYHILVSEIMLQQTQVARVIEKYSVFIREFPTVESLARAPLRKILGAWQGLGYNRRALALKRLAERIVLEWQGKVPDKREMLMTLPGIGEATAGALCAFAFNEPVVFIETNIRSVFLHHFFKDKKGVSDEQLLLHVARTLDRRNPRRWYSALMDYGSFLKVQLPNPSRKSLHYRIQSPFKGSDRQIRGRIIKMLVSKNRIRESELAALLGAGGKKTGKILQSLSREGLIRRRGGYLEV